MSQRFCFNVVINFSTLQCFCAWQSEGSFSEWQIFARPTLSTKSRFDSFLNIFQSSVWKPFRLLEIKCAMFRRMDLLEKFNSGLLSFEFLFFELTDFIKDDLAFQLGLVWPFVDRELRQHFFHVLAVLEVRIKLIFLDDEWRRVFEFLPHSFVLLDLLLLDSFLKRIHFLHPVRYAWLNLLDCLHVCFGHEVVYRVGWFIIEWGWVRIGLGGFLVRLQLGKFAGAMGFSLFLVFVDLADRQWLFGKGGRSLDGLESFLVNLIGLLLYVKLIELGQKTGFGFHQVC